ncbi:LOW QUALITY PROTEIN: hypothetical protein T265_13873, partial [Opisthorchis viverrini]
MFRTTVDERSARATGVAAGIQRRHGATQRGGPLCRTYRPIHDVSAPCPDVQFGMQPGFYNCGLRIRKELQLADIYPVWGKPDHSVIPNKRTIKSRWIRHVAEINEATATFGLGPLWLRRIRLKQGLLHHLIYRRAYIADCCPEFSSRIPYNTRNSGCLLSLSTCRTVFRQNFFLCLYSKLWNKLPSHIRTISSHPRNGRRGSEKGCAVPWQLVLCETEIATGNPADVGSRIVSLLLEDR